MIHNLKIERRLIESAAMAAAVGLISWSGIPYLLPVALLYIPLIFFRSKTRMEAFFIAFVYHLSATRGLIAGASIFFDSGIFLGFMICAAGNLVIASVYGLCWSSNRNKRLALIFLALVVLSFPPFGVIGWANPLSGAGILFPASGFTGLFMMILLGEHFCLIKEKWSKIMVAVIAIFSILTHLLFSESKEPDWQGMTTNFVFDSSNPDPMEGYNRQKEMMRMSNDSSSKIMVFAESSLGSWNRASESLWKEQLKDGHTIIAGAMHEDSNVMVSIRKEGGLIYRQRQPIPLSMWRPWAKDSIKAHWFEIPVTIVDRKIVAPFICYELFLMWPVLHSMSHDPEAMIYMSNLWWAKDTSIPKITDALAKSWSDLFGIKAIGGVNL